MYNTIATIGIDGTAAKVWEGITHPYTSRWNSGDQAGAIGYGTVEVLLAIVGTKGITKATKAARLADETVIVMGGTKPVPAAGEVFSGMQGRTLEEAAAGVPHNQVQWTTAGDIRKAGGSVLPNPEFNPKVGAKNYQHVDVCLGSGSCNWRGPLPNPVPSAARFGRPDYPFYDGYLGWGQHD